MQYRDPSLLGPFAGPFRLLLMGLVILLSSCSSDTEESDPPLTAPDVSWYDAGPDVGSVIDDTGDPTGDDGTPTDIEEDTAPEDQPCKKEGVACRGSEGILDPTSGVCILPIDNEGGGCHVNATSTGMFDGQCQGGTCVPLTTVCTGSDPEGCWTEAPGDGECIQQNVADGTPCGSAGNWCVDGACAYTPACGPEVLLHPGAQPAQYNGQCAGNTGCTDVCVPDTCGCWACDGPVCADSGCDESGGSVQTMIAVSAEVGLEAEPAGSLSADPQPLVVIDGSAEWDGAGDAYPILLLAQYNAAPPEAAAWIDESGTEQTQGLIDAAIVGNALLVGRVKQFTAPCEVATSIDTDDAPSVVFPSAGDAATVEFQVTATADGETAIVWIRVLEDSGGHRYYEWIHLGGWSAAITTPTSGPTPLTATVRHPLPDPAVKPLELIWPGFDWRAALSQ